MKKDIKIATQNITIQKLTALMQGTEKYAYINFPRSALIAMKNSEEKGSNKAFSNAIKSSFSIEDNRYMKGIPPAFVNSNDAENELDFSVLKNGEQYYNSTTLENYFNNNETVFSSFVDFFIKHNPSVVVSFHDKKIVNRVLGSHIANIYVPYNDYYDKVDAICSSLVEYQGKADTVILDCPLLSAALAGKIWNQTNFSIIDFGKVVSFARARFLNKVAQNEKGD